MNLANMPVQRSLDDLQRMSNRELLEAIWETESVYKEFEDHSHDHRQYLSRGELERVLLLAQRRVELRAEATS